MIKRIMIIGLPGAGKSTLAAQLGKQLQLPIYHIDKYYWKPNWQKYSIEEWQKIHDKLINKPEWIIEGCAIKSSFMQRFAKADLVIYLHLPRPLCLWRMIKRCIGIRDFSLNDRPAGCREGLPWRLIRYMWTFDSQLMSRLLPEAQKNMPTIPVVIINNDKELAFFVKQILRSIH